jgi:Flp pilus assembly protein TadD
MGWVLFRLGRLDEAEQYLRHAWTLDQNPEIAAHLGEVLWRQGRREEARAKWQEGRSVDETNAVLGETVRRLESEP